jgi:hypothetical protein
MKTRSSVVMAIAAAVCLGAAPASGQTDVRRLEIGGHFSTLQVGDAGNTNAGLGGRVSYEFLPWLALEGDLSYFPNDRLDVDLGPSSLMLQTQYSRRRLEGFVGPKVGVRGERFGAFAKVRPGFAHLIDKGVRCVGELCALARPCLPALSTTPSSRSTSAASSSSTRRSGQSHASIWARP